MMDVRIFNSSQVELAIDQLILQCRGRQVERITIILDLYINSSQVESIKCNCKHSISLSDLVVVSILLNSSKIESNAWFSSNIL